MLSELGRLGVRATSLTKGLWDEGGAAEHLSKGVVARRAEGKNSASRIARRPSVRRLRSLHDKTLRGTGNANKKGEREIQ